MFTLAITFIFNIAGVTGYTIRLGYKFRGEFKENA
jgi:hypothetical protein